MKLVWHAENLREADWLRDLLGDLVEAETLDLNNTCFDDDTLHVVSSNRAPLASYEDYFKRLRETTKRVALYHASDEWYSGGYRAYGHFDFVLRNYDTYLVSSPGVITLPLGYSNGTSHDDGGRAADQRRYAWSFVGELKASRLDMASAFRSFEPGLLIATSSISDAGGRKLSKPEFDGVLADSAFSPCPMGNVVLETWRLYESLELGCIPLAEARANLDYFTNLLGPNPIPCFRDWREARRYAQALFLDKPALVRTQDSVRAWWKTFKAKLGADVREALAGPSHASSLRAFGRQVRFGSPAPYEPLRLVELLRHQSASSLRLRLAQPLKPLKRIWREVAQRGA